jgi:hypothetical protein
MQVCLSPECTTSVDDSTISDGIFAIGGAGMVAERGGAAALVRSRRSRRLGEAVLRRAAAGRPRKQCLTRGEVRVRRIRGVDPVSIGWRVVGRVGNRELRHLRVRVDKKSRFLFRRLGRDRNGRMQEGSPDRGQLKDQGQMALGVVERGMDLDLRIRNREYPCALHRADLEELILLVEGLRKQFLVMEDQGVGRVRIRSGLSG